MVNKKSITPSVAAGAVTSITSANVGAVTPTISTGSSNTGGSTTGGGTSSGSPAAGAVPLVTPSRLFRNELTAIANGFGTQFPANSAIVVNGQSINQSSIIAALQATLALYGNVDAAVQATKSNRLVLQAALPAAHQFVVGLKAALVAFFGKGNPALTAFGLSDSKPRQLTVEQKLVRKQKAAATRVLRGTTGKRAKALVKFSGTVDVQTNLSGTQTVGGNASPAGSNSAGPSNTPATSGNASGSGTPSSGA